VVGDFNNDGKQDLAVANFLSGTAAILYGTGTGSFGPPNLSPPVSQPIWLAVGDFNGDGIQDLAIVNSYTPNIQILMRRCAVNT
jgi:hypothetical protein